MIYPIIFAEDPLAHVDRVAEMVVAPEKPRSYPPVEDFIGAIDAGLASTEKLARLLPPGQPEDVIRAYLTALREKLLARRPDDKDRP